MGSTGGEINESIKSRLSKLKLHEVGINTPSGQKLRLSRSQTVGYSISHTYPGIVHSSSSEVTEPPSATVRKVPPPRPPPPSPLKIPNRSSTSFPAQQLFITPGGARPSSANPFNDAWDDETTVSNCVPTETNARHSDVSTVIPRPRPPAISRPTSMNPFNTDWVGKPFEPSNGFPQEANVSFGTNSYSGSLISRPSAPVVSRPRSTNPFLADWDDEPSEPCNYLPGKSKSRHSNIADGVPRPVLPRPLSLPVNVQSTTAVIVPAPQNQRTCLICRDFSVVDAHAAKFPRQDVLSIPSLARDLTFQFPSKTDKARAIFIWLHYNVAYDTNAYFSQNVRKQTPEETLRSGLAVCQGYAELFAELSRHSGLEATVISGHGKGYGFNEINGDSVPEFNSNHAWNAVKVDNEEWRLIDACWGAGTVDINTGFTKRLNVDYFLSPPEKFRMKHFPTNSQDQFCSTLISWTEYIMMKDTSPKIYTVFDERGFSRETLQPATKIISPAPTKFTFTTKCKHLSIHPQNQYVLLLEVDGQYSHFQVDPTNRIWTCEHKALTSGSYVNAYYLEKLDGIDAIGIGVHGYLQAKNRKYMNFQSLCRWEVY